MTSPLYFEWQMFTRSVRRRECVKSLNTGKQSINGDDFVSAFILKPRTRHVCVLKHKMHYNCLYTDANAPLSWSVGREQPLWSNVHVCVCDVCVLLVFCVGTRVRLDKYFTKARSTLKTVSSKITYTWYT